MTNLCKFVMDHAERGTCRCGKCCDHPGEDTQPDDHTVDMVFFNVSAKNNPDADQLRELINESDFDPWDGKEHSYIEVGGWIGDQGVALMLMGLGALLGLWKLMTPKMISGLPDDLVQLMAGQGMITIMDDR